jgi:hypothetical protein
MAAAEHLLDALEHVRSHDEDMERELLTLRRELRTQRKAGTPWRARSRFDILATLDLVAWAAVSALLDECPVMLANVSCTDARRPHTVTPSEFQFIAHAGHIALVHAFLRALREQLAC